MQIKCYDDFTTAILECGFSMGGGNAHGTFAVIPFGWEEQPPYETPVRWHTGDPETDPWEWRIRVLDERNDIAYSKVFFKLSGYITREWYPYFLAVRRGGKTFDELYDYGEISQYAKRIYDLLEQNESLPLHAIKQLGGFASEDKSKFDKAMTELQMKLLITMCGRAQKRSKTGEEYGWSSTVFTTTECFWGNEVFAEASQISKEQAIEKITAQIYKLNPQANPKKILKFIKG